ncbi:hypothetical protein D3C77_658940 [compost metagenome]
MVSPAIVVMVWPIVVTVLPRLVTFTLVSFSCEPFTASVLVADTSPAATLVMVVELPPWFRVTLL